jgi:hypothetical protein
MPPPIPPAAELTLTWVDNSTNEESFEILKKTGSGSFSKFTAVGPNETMYVDTQVQVGETYCYIVAAVNSAGRANNVGGQACAIPGVGPTTPPPTVPPDGAPGQLTIGCKPQPCTVFVVP